MLWGDGGCLADRAAPDGDLEDRGEDRIRRGRSRSRRWASMRDLQGGPAADGSSRNQRRIEDETRGTVWSVAAAAARSRVRDELIAPGTTPEIELQARWFSGEYGRDFKTVDGRSVKVIQFGVWNREAGPDFAEAAISINGGEAVRGAIELDMDARDWERHGHATNEAYEGVVLHLFFQSGDATAFARTLSNRAVPQVHLDLHAAGGPPPNPVPLAAPGRCVAPLRDLDLPTVRGVLEGAAQFRLQRKAARLARLRQARGEDEALYQALGRHWGISRTRSRLRC